MGYKNETPSEGVGVRGRSLQKQLVRIETRLCAES